MKSDQKTERSRLGRILQWLKGAFTRNLKFKVLALVFAMVLWGYVLTQINPERVKSVQDVLVSFDGENALMERGLVVRGNRDEILENVTVRVKTELTQYADLSADDVNATINLNTVSKSGTVTLPIRAYTSIGSADSVVPEKITLEIDELAIKKVPVEVQYEGTLPEGYWIDDPVLSANEVEIRGAATDVNRISKAVCIVPLTDRTESFNEAVNLRILDSNGGEIVSDYFIGETPSISVRMRVLPKKSVPVILDHSIFGLDSLPAIYEIVEMKTSPSTVNIVGTEAALALVDALEVEGVDVSGRTESLHVVKKLKLPEGIETQSGSNEVEVYINIQEKQITKSFQQVPIGFVGFDEKQQSVRLSIDALDVDLTGRTTLVSGLSADEMKLYVNITGLGEGIYQLPVVLELNDPTTMQELITQMSSGLTPVTTVKVTIEKN